METNEKIEVVNSSGPIPPAAGPGEHGEDLVQPPVITIQPSRGWVAVRLREVWESRELLAFLTIRDIKIKYKQSVLGAFWAVLNPVLTMVVFTLIFGRVAKIPSDDVPYPLFSFAGLVPWTLFATGLQRGSDSLVNSAHLVKKVYFPRLVLPMAAVFAALVDFMIALAVLLLLMALWGFIPGQDTHYFPTANAIFLPFLVLLALISSLGLALWLSALNVQFRDVRHTLPLLTQMLLYATPIAYPASLIENPTVRLIYSLNPMAGVVEGFRWALLGTDTAPGGIILVSSLAAVLLLAGGAVFFARMERSFADVV